MTGTPSEQDVRAALPARATPRTWLDQITQRPAEQPATTRKPLHPGVGIAVLACACGRAIHTADMRRAQPVRDTPTDSPVIRPIVCAHCAGSTP